MSLSHFTESTSLVVEENNPFNNRRGPSTTISPQLFPHWLPLVLILCAGLLLIFGTSEHATNQSQLLAIAIAMETAAFLIFYHDLHEVRADVKTIDQKIDKNHAEAMTKMDTLHRAALKDSDMKQHVVLEQVQKLDQKVEFMVNDFKNHVDTKMTEMKNELKTELTEELTASLTAAFNAILDERGVHPAPPRPDELTRQVS